MDRPATGIYRQRILIRFYPCRLPSTIRSPLEKLSPAAKGQCPGKEIAKQHPDQNGPASPGTRQPWTSHRIDTWKPVSLKDLGANMYWRFLGKLVRTCRGLKIQRWARLSEIQGQDFPVRACPLIRP